MATTKAKKTAAKKKATPRQTGASLQAKKQMWAVVLFALGILLGALTLVSGEKLWLVLHDILFGLFGWSVYFLSPLIIYIAVISALDRPLSAIKTKLWQVAILVIMISSAIQIFGEGMPSGANIAQNIRLLYIGGKETNGGGVSSAIFAMPLLLLFEKTGASIIISLGIFVMLMLVTGSTLIGLLRSAAKPVRDIEEVYANTLETRNARNASTPPAKAPPAFVPPPGAPKFDIDVDINGSLAKNQQTELDIELLPQHPVVSEKSPLSDTAKDKLLSFSVMDSPVEYISPAQFVYPTLPKSEPEPEPEPAPRVHPLEEDILLAEQQDFSGIEEIVGRLSVPEQEAACASETVTAPQAKKPDAVQDVPVFSAKTVVPKPVNLPYTHPPISLLQFSKGPKNQDITEELKNNAQTLVDTLKSFGVQTRITDICRGPAVTRYELQPSAGVKISKITGLADDIALNLASAGIRIEAPIPNKAAVGIEVPNKHVSIVSIRDLIGSDEFEKASSNLAVALGKDIAGNIMLADIGKMPHMLIAGSTGSGKSVCINSIIVSILYKSSPDQVKLLMVDPKVVELGVYNGIPHLLVPVVTDPRKAAGALSWAVNEMQNRYKAFAANGVRDLAGYNRVCETKKEIQPMPQIVIIIDELADLMMAAPNDVEDSICRLAQMARAAGMHLVIATQRPSVDVITGVIKANIPSRIAFAVSSQVDSRTILDMGGAEKLLGRGDMLFYPVGSSKPVRVQGCFVTDSEVEKIVEFVKQSDEAEYDEDIAQQINSHTVAEKSNGKSANKDSGGGLPDDDEMLPQAIECVIEAGQASTSLLQRRLRLGYARAARIIDQLEEKGIVGPFEGSKPRTVIITRDQWLEKKLSGAEDAQMAISK